LLLRASPYDESFTLLKGGVLAFCVYDLVLVNLVSLNARLAAEL